MPRIRRKKQYPRTYSSARSLIRAKRRDMASFRARARQQRERSNISLTRFLFGK